MESLNIADKKARILRYILRNRQMTRGELVEHFGWTLVTVTKLVGDLLDAGLIKAIGSVNNGVGRHKELLGINPEYRLTIGMDIGFTGIRIGVVGFDGRILEAATIPNGPDPDENGVDLAAAVAAICAYIGSYGRSRFLGVGVGISGMVDFHSGRVLFCPNISGFNDRDLKNELSDALGLPVMVDTSARCMALGESAFGLGYGVSDMLFLSIGAGTISAGIIQDRRLSRGADGFAGDIGHNQVEPAVNPKGVYQRCTCGRKLCLELQGTLYMVLHAVQTELPDYTGYSPAKKLAGDGVLTPDQMAEAFREGDILVSERIERAAYLIGRELANSVNLLNPSLVVLGGGFIRCVPELTEMIRSVMLQYCLVPMQSRITVAASTLGDDAPLQGAAIQIVYHYLSQSV